MLPEDARLCPQCASSRVSVDTVSFDWSPDDEITDMVCDRCGFHWCALVRVTDMLPGAQKLHDAVTRAALVR